MLLVGIPMMIVSMVLFATKSGISVLDVVDKFINNTIALNALVMLVLIVWVLRRFNELQIHLNAVSTLWVGTWWKVCISVITPLALLWMILTEFGDLIVNGYGGYPGWFVGVFGWGCLVVCAIGGIIMSVVRWSDRILQLHGPMFTPETMPEYQTQSYKRHLAKVGADPADHINEEKDS